MRKFHSERREVIMGVLEAVAGAGTLLAAMIGAVLGIVRLWGCLSG